MVLAVENTDVDLDVRVSRLRVDGIHTDPFTVNRTDIVTSTPSAGVVYQTRTNQGSDDWADNPDVYGHPPYCVRARLTSGSELSVAVESSIKVMQAPPLGGSVTIDPPFDYTGVYAFEIDTTIAGETPNDTIKMTFPGTFQLFTVDWGDSSPPEDFNYVTADTFVQHTYAVPGVYEVRVTGGLKQARWYLTDDRLKLLRVLASNIPFNNYNQAYRDCDNLTEILGPIDTTATSDFTNAFRGTGITDLPDVDYSVPNIKLTRAFLNSSLATFDTSRLDVLNGSITAVDIFRSTNLTEATVDGILSSLDNNPNLTPTNIGLSGSGPAPPSVAGLVSKNSLIAKGWTVNTN